MKILLANPATRESISPTKERYFIKAGSRWPWSYIKNKKDKNTYCVFPFFLAYTANILRNNGYEVYVIDGVALDLETSDFLERLKWIKPNLIIIETTTHAIKYDLALCKQIKQIIPKVLILLAGAHVTVFAKEILKSSEYIDFIALGEYEYTVLELSKRLQNNSVDLKIKGLAYKKKNEIWVSDEKGFIEDINKLPYPAFDLFPSNDQPNLAQYRDGICIYYPAVTLHSSRGCPFRCDFCMWNQVIYNNGPYRMFEPKRVVDEMEYVIKHFGAREIYFDDDDFCVNKKHVMDICTEIKKRNLKIKWSCMGDAIVCDEEMIRLMAESGCISMKFGVESGNKQILKNIGKPLNPKKAIEVANLCRKYGIMTHATFCFGLDGETKETMKETLRLANRIKFDTAQVSIATPFPGTRYYQKLVDKGYLDAKGWDCYDGTRSCTFNTKYLSSQDIESFRKKAIRSMVLHKIFDPVWFGRFLKRNLIILRNYGFKTMLEPIKAFMNL